VCSRCCAAQLPLTFVARPEHWPGYHPSVELPSPPAPVRGADYPESNPLIEVPGEEVVLGKDRAYPSFGWDNEYGRREMQVRV
jgi:hypothetical protein